MLHRKIQSFKNCCDQYIQLILSNMYKDSILKRTKDRKINRKKKVRSNKKGWIKSKYR